MNSPAGLVHATLDKLTAWLGAAPHQQDVVYSEASARKALSRRAFLRTAGAVAAGVVLADRVIDAEASFRAMAEARAAAERVHRSTTSQIERSLRELAERMKEYRPAGPVFMHPDDHAKMVELGYAPPLEPSDELFLSGDIADFELGSVWNYSTGETGASRVVVTSVDRSRGVAYFMGVDRDNV